jgi:hypothetical protein
MQTEEWRKQYWATFHAGVTNKLTDWQHEQEYRITLQSRLADLSNPAERTLKYPFEKALTDGMLLNNFFSPIRRSRKKNGEHPLCRETLLHGIGAGACI